MSDETLTRVVICSELCPGDAVEAKGDNQPRIRGEVTDIMPEQGLLWIREAPLGDRLILDMGEVEVFRIRREYPIPASRLH